MRKFAGVLFFVIAFSMPLFAQTVGLKDVYANKFRFGSIFNGTTINEDKEAVLKEFNSITPENELKPDATLVQNGSTNTDIKVQLNNGARAILKFCEENNIPVRGHTLVWHSQTPQWFFKDNFQNSGNWVTAAVMDQRMESYIKNMFALITKDFPNLNLYAYDVVNEAASEDGSYRTAGSDAANGQSMWVQVYGNNSFIKKAFEYARKYAPKGTKLFYNDYNEYISKKRDYIATSIVKPLYDEGLLDGMGMQSHLDVKTGGNNAYPSPTLFGQAIEMYKKIGVEIQVTELDATVDGNSYFTAQATYYENIMKQILDQGGDAITAVVVWGVRDENSWRGGKSSSQNRYPLLFDNNGKKAAYTALFNLIPESEWGNGNDPGTPSDNFKLTANASPSIGGYIDKNPNSASYALGSSVTLTAQEAEGWVFAGWSGASESMQKEIIISMNENKTLTAKFTPIEDGTTNLVNDGNFPGSSLTSNWSWNTGQYYGDSEGTNSVSDGKVTLNITKSGSETYQPQLIQQGLALEQGIKYRLTFTASAGAARTIDVGFQQSSDPWGPYADTTFNLTASEQVYTFEFEMSKPSDPNVQLSFNVGGSGTNGTSVAISNVKLIYLAGDPVPVLNSLFEAKFQVRSLSNKLLQVQSNANAEIYLYDIRGNAVQKIQVSAGSSIVKLSVPSGIYIVKQSKTGKTQTVMVK